MQLRLLLLVSATNQKPTERGVTTPLQYLYWGDYVIISVTELKRMPEFKGIHETTLLRKLKAVESLIRSYTNNNFQNRLIRFSTASSENELLGVCEYLRVGDTVQISESINDGLYTVKSIGTFTTR